MMDSDEFYIQSEFEKEKELIYEKEITGTVCRVKAYFKKPTLTIGYEYTLVPFIHRLKPNLKYKFNDHSYPFAVEGKRGRIDPTRRLNITRGVEMSDVTMHHYSWVRENFEMKLNNSSANFKGNRSEVIYNDLKNAKPGYFLQGYQRELVECENIFKLPLYE